MSKKPEFEFRRGDGGYDYLSLRTERNMMIEFYCRDRDVDYVRIRDEEIAATDDDLYEIYVRISGEYYSLHALLKFADNEYDSISDDLEAQDADDAAMDRELSCPQATGRI